MIALDPGGTTGLATCDYEAGAYAYFIATQCTPQEALDWVWSCIEHNTSIVYAERYTVTPRTVKMTRQYDALYVIGAAQWMCKHTSSTFKLVDPATSKKLGNDRVLRDSGLWTPGKQHANDAARVLAVALVEAGCDTLAFR